MTPNVRNNNTGVSKILNRLAEDKKKSVTALCLISVMAVMWIRVVTRKTPDGAEAAPVTDQTNTEDVPREEYRVSFVELPKVAGRNDVIGRDFFASNGWRHFVDRQRRKRGGIEKVSIVSTNGNEEVIGRIAEKLNLEATIVGGTPRAFMNGQVLKIGRKLSINDGADPYECEVIDIKDNAVVIKCREAEIRLSIKP
ncbi:MAG: hypothetical protein ACYSTZ_06150 [Planctomycetota bacterium]|jgi:hypothetical protein